MRYDYKCPNCDKDKVIERPMAEDPVDYFCDDCGTQIKQVLGAPAAFIPGPGMYSHRGG